MRTFDGRVYETFRDAAVALVLIENQQQWRNCIREAITIEKNIRRFLFANFLLHCQPIDLSPSDLWNEYRLDLSRDCLRNEPIATTKALNVILDN